MKQVIAGVLALFSGLCLAAQTSGGAGLDPTGQVFFSFSLQGEPRDGWRPRVGLRLGSNRSPTLDWEKPDFFDTAITLQIEPSGETSLSLAGIDFGFDEGFGLFRRLEPAASAPDDTAFAAFDGQLPDRRPLNLIAPASGGASLEPAVAAEPATAHSSTWIFKQLAQAPADRATRAPAAARPATVTQTAAVLPKDQASAAWRFRVQRPGRGIAQPRAILQSAAFVARARPELDRVKARQLAARAVLPKPIRSASSQRAWQFAAVRRTADLVVPPAVQQRWALRPVARKHAKFKPVKARQAALFRSFNQDTRR